MRKDLISMSATKQQEKLPNGVKIINSRSQREINTQRRIKRDQRIQSMRDRVQSILNEQDNNKLLL